MALALITPWLRQVAFPLFLSIPRLGKLLLTGLAHTAGAGSSAAASAASASKSAAAAAAAAASGKPQGLHLDLTVPLYHLCTCCTARGGNEPPVPAASS